MDPLQLKKNFEEQIASTIKQITELEEQIQKLTASNEDTLFKMDQLTERLEKIQADNELRLSDLESGDPKKIADLIKRRVIDHNHFVDSKQNKYGQEFKLKQIPIKSNQTYIDTNVSDHHNFFDLIFAKQISV